MKVSISLMHGPLPPFSPPLDALFGATRMNARGVLQYQRDDDDDEAPLI